VRSVRARRTAPDRRSVLVGVKRAFDTVMLAIGLVVALAIAAYAIWWIVILTNDSSTIGAIAR
jgi:lipopolysaccharide/colanic/teichoic acid biosynthesis glycosyltransferase